MRNSYKQYFKDHYKSTFIGQDIDNYRKWFYTQWRFINSKIKINPDSKILEIGSGLGGFYSFFDKKNQYLGIEIDNEAVEFGNSYFKVSKFRAESIEQLVESRSFDLIFAFEVLEHLDDPLVVLNKIRKLLSTEGIFCGTTPFPYRKNIIADETHMFVLHPDNWKRLLLKSGFYSVELYPMSFLPYIWRISPNLNFRIPIYLPFKNFISTCLIIAKK